MLTIASTGINVVGLTNAEPAALAILCRTILIVTTMGMVVAGLLLFVPRAVGTTLKADHEDGPSHWRDR